MTRPNTVTTLRATLGEPTTHSRDMQAYDRLPAAHRKAVREFPAKIDCASVIRDIAEHGAEWSLADIARLRREVEAEWRSKPCGEPPKMTVRPRRQTTIVRIGGP